MRHLEAIKGKLGLANEHKELIGATWYGCLGLSRAAANLSDRVMRWMHIHEFTKYQRDGGDYGDLWPQWHYGVLTMYGGHIAVHYVNQFQVSGDEFVMDASSHKSEALGHAIKHIHCWHTFE